MSKSKAFHVKKLKPMPTSFTAPIPKGLQPFTTEGGIVLAVSQEAADELGKWQALRNAVS